MPRDSENSRIEREIDANLKRAFEDVVNEDVPDRFKDLLQQLKQTERSSSRSANNDER